MDVLDKLSPTQLASLTLSSDAINEEEEMCQILAKLHNKPSEEIYQYLDQFNREAAQVGVLTLQVQRKAMPCGLQLSRFSKTPSETVSELLSQRMNNCHKVYHIQPLTVAVWPKASKRQRPRLSGWLTPKRTLPAALGWYQAELLNLTIRGPAEEADPPSHFPPEPCTCLCLSGHKRPACRQHAGPSGSPAAAVSLHHPGTPAETDSCPLVLAADTAGSQDIPKMHLPFSGTPSELFLTMLFPVPLPWGPFLILPSH